MPAYWRILTLMHHPHEYTLWLIRRKWCAADDCSILQQNIAGCASVRWQTINIFKHIKLSGMNSRSNWSDAKALDLYVRMNHVLSPFKPYETAYQNYNSALTLTIGLGIRLQSISAQKLISNAIIVLVLLQWKFILSVEQQQPRLFLWRCGQLWAVRMAHKRSQLTINRPSPQDIDVELIQCIFTAITTLTCTG